MVPEVVRLEKAGVCGCGQVVAAGERAGTTRQPGRVVCLQCLAGFSASGDDRSTVYYEAPEDSPAPELPEPVAVVIPADWGPSSPDALPAWQRTAGVVAALPPAVPVPPPAATPPVPTVAVQFTAPAPAAEVAPPAPPVAVSTPAPAGPAAASVLATVSEAAAIVGPAHRRRTFLPAGLLALRASRGREPGVTGLPDGATRALLEAASDAGVLSLHDRRMPGRRGRIAHLALGAAGVFVIDVVRAKRAAVEVRATDELAPECQELVVGGRPMTATVAATQGRVAIVRALLDEVELSAVPVIGVMCFVDAAVPADADLEVAGVQVIGKTGLPALVRSEGALGADHLETLREYLTERLPAA